MVARLVCEDLSLTFLFADAPDAMALLRVALEQADYSTGGVRELLGKHFLGYLARNEVAAVLRRTEDGSPRSSLVRLFLVGAAVDRRAAGAALAPLELEDAERAGLVAGDGTKVRGRVSLRPLEAGGRRFVVATDAPAAWAAGPDEEDNVAPDHVIGVGASSLMLARMTVRDQVPRALDVGTGGGVQALHASMHAGEVVATDLNPRALCFARLSLALSGVANVTTREGSLFSPVAGERFDLIVSNPPFVVSPESRLVFRDGGLEADGICRHLVREAPSHLEEGGFCQLLANWVHPAGASWQDRLAEWFEGTGCDVWVLQRSIEDVEEYAVGWVLHSDAVRTDPKAQAKILDDWMSYYARLGIERIGFGLITLRRRASGNPFVRFEELPREPVGPCGDDIARSFERRDWLNASGDDALLDARLVIAPDVQIHQELIASGGRFQTAAGELRRTTGLGRVGIVDEHAARVVARCDGTATLRSILGDLAASLGAPTDTMAAVAIAPVRSLVEQGFLLPAAGG